MKKQKGFVLVAVLMFMQVFALLGLTALDEVFLTEKLLSDQKAKRLLLNEAERILAELSTSIQQIKRTCSISVLSPQQLSTYPLAWWFEHACQSRATRLRAYYVVEPLGKDACAKLRGEKQAEAVYYRLTLLLLKENEDNLRVLLQSTLATEDFNLGHCDSEQHFVDSGAQSWYQLS
ncbi:MAG TPA: hypothetical protein VLH77_06800 [Gammaproteobacteria bacterium]|nr:hypothetical protein [Gammaproteobacteria bacterium]